ncbi:MAG: hypothetical protein AAGE59_28595 [Cyanobacteria bacterium P01_F01_bin.86]
MTTESTNSPQIAPDDPESLAKLRSLVERVMADGKISPEEADEIRDALIEDGQITLDEIEVIRTVMREKLGDAPLKFG